ncbi:hypothetical protein N7G274_009516 [Stereocaulon virgatum]|uniref:Uncharacterized protein n=1 Tax=Stereocaulon virgatum TaxID=373712 RepID=A0ABR3ZYM4_9LECA
MPCECEPEKTSAHLRHISVSSSGDSTGSTETLATFSSSIKSVPSSIIRVSTKGHPLQCYGQNWGGPKIWEVAQVEKLMAKCRECQKLWCKKKEQRVVEGGVRVGLQGHEKPKGKGKEAERGGEKVSATKLEKSDARGAAKHDGGYVQDEDSKDGEQKAADDNASNCLEQLFTGQGSDMLRMADNIFERKAFTPLLNDEAKKVGGKNPKEPGCVGQDDRSEEGHWRVEAKSGG